jgi:hypothetical protein
MSYFHAYQAYEHQRELGVFDPPRKTGPSSQAWMLHLLAEISAGLIRAGSFLKPRPRIHPSGVSLPALRRLYK